MEWNSFKHKMNEFLSLTLEFSNPSSSVDFMDMTITVNEKNQIETTLFENKLYLHLYPPPPPPPPLCPPTRATTVDHV